MLILLQDRYFVIDTIFCFLFAKNPSESKLKEKNLKFRFIVKILQIRTKEIYDD